MAVILDYELYFANRKVDILFGRPSASSAIAAPSAAGPSAAPPLPTVDVPAALPLSAVAAAWDKAGAGDTAELPAVADAKEEECSACQCLHRYRLCERSGVLPCRMGWCIVLSL